MSDAIRSEVLSATAYSVPILLDAAVKSGVILALAGLVVYGLRGRVSAAANHVIWLLALLGLLMLPVLSLGLPPLRGPGAGPGWGWSVLPDWGGGESAAAGPGGVAAGNEAGDAALPPSSVDAGSPVTDVPPQSVALEAGQRNTEADAQSPPAGVSAVTAAEPVLLWRDWRVVVMLVWLLGVAVALLPLMAGLVGLVRLRRGVGLVTDNDWLLLLRRLLKELGMRSTVVLLQSGRCSMPMTWGFYRHHLLLPEEAEGWPAQRRHIVLLHELAHIKRRDCLTQCFARIVCAMYWFNPLAWFALHRLAVERERACDDLILNTGCRASDYAEHLLQIASGVGPDPFAARTAIAMARRSKLEGRLRMILDSTRNRQPLSRLGTLLAGVLCAALVTPLAMMRAAEPETEPVVEEKGGEKVRGFDIRLIGVRPNGEEELFDAQGRPIGTMPDYAGRNPVWHEDEMRRDFIFEVDRTQEPLRILNPVLVRPADSSRMFGAGSGSIHLVDKREGNPGRVGVLSTKLDQTYTHIESEDEWSTQPVRRVDITLHYYLGPRGPADARFSGPFEAGEQIEDDAGRGYQLTIEPVPFAQRLRFQVHVDEMLDPSTPLIVYDTAGHWHLAERGGGFRSPKKSTLEYRLNGVPLDTITAITFNEKPHEKHFHDIPVRYDHLDGRNPSHALYLDKMAARLGLDVDQDRVNSYDFKSPQEAVSVIDVVRGHPIHSACDAIVSAHPRVTPDDFNERDLQRIREAAWSWLDAADAMIRMKGVQLGLWGNWPEFYDPAMEMVRDGGFTGRRAARAILNYNGNLTPAQLHEVRDVLLKGESDAAYWDFLFILRNRQPATTDALLDLVRSDRVSLWWPAIEYLMDRESGKARLLELAAESPVIRSRVILAAGADALPGATPQQVNAAHALLPNLVTPALFRANYSLFHRVWEAMVEHVDRQTATAAAVRFLKQQLDEWELSYSDHSANTTWKGVNLTVHQLKQWYDLDLPSVDMSVFPPPGKGKHDWRAEAAEAIRWYETHEAP